MNAILQTYTIVTVCLACVSLFADETKPQVSLKTIVTELNLEHPKKEREKIFKSPAKVIGYKLRAKYDLWNEKSMVRVYFEKHGIKHPDWISGCIYDAWRKSNTTGGLDEAALLHEYAGKQRGWEEWTEDLKKSPEKYLSKDRDPFALEEKETESEPSGAGQPATAPESKPGGSEKPQPESEGRSR